MNKNNDYSVLVVEDDQDTLDFMKRFLSRDFAHVHTASNGREGIEQFRLIRPSVVVTDIQMPEMDGIEMIDLLVEEDPGLPIIVATGYDDDAHHTGKAWHTLIKPINYKELTMVIMDCLSRPKQARSGG